MQNYFKNLDIHHAYLMEGAREIIIPKLFLFLEKEWNFSIDNNPNFWCGKFETFGIDDGRSIKELESRYGIGGGKKIFVISANFFTREAQNSLLKVLEEPTSDTHFFIITQNTQSLLPTLKSRLHIVRDSSQKLSFDDNGNTIAGEFLRATISKRAELLKDIIENKDKNEAIKFLNNLESVLYYKDVGRPTSHKVGVFEEIRKCRGYLNGRSPSVKMILGHIAIVV